jgi:hypothetical protein
MRGGLISSRSLKAIAIQQSRLTINAFVDRNLRRLTRSRGTRNSLWRATPSRTPGAATREVLYGDQNSDLRCLDRNGSGDSRDHVRSGLGSDTVASAMKVIAQSLIGMTQSMRLRRTPKKPFAVRQIGARKWELIDVVGEKVVGVFTTDTAAGEMARKLIVAERAGRTR